MKAEGEGGDRQTCIPVGNLEGCPPAAASPQKRWEQTRPWRLSDRKWTEDRVEWSSGREDMEMIPLGLTWRGDKLPFEICIYSRKAKPSSVAEWVSPAALTCLLRGVEKAEEV